jgi:hypothetical protein
MTCEQSTNLKLPSIIVGVIAFLNGACNKHKTCNAQLEQSKVCTVNNKIQAGTQLTIDYNLTDEDVRKLGIDCSECIKSDLQDREMELNTDPDWRPSSQSKRPRKK